MPKPVSPTTPPAAPVQNDISVVNNQVLFKGHLYNVTIANEDGSTGVLSDPAVINEIVQILLASSVASKTNDLSKASIINSGIQIDQGKSVEKIEDKTVVARIDALFKNVFPSKTPERKEETRKTSESVQFRSLPNQGNTCYMNSSLQFLLSTNFRKHLFAEAAEKRRNKEPQRDYQLRLEFIRHLRAFYEAVENAPENVENRLEELYKLVPTIHQELKGRFRQQDAPAFTQLALYAVGSLTVINREVKGTNSNGLEEEKREYGLVPNLIVPIHDEGSNLQYLLQPSKGKVEDRKINENACTYCTSTERLALQGGEPPEEVYIQLERFVGKYDANNKIVDITKNHNALDFTGDEDHRFNLKHLIENTDKECVYELVGIINHMGAERKSGHYVAKVKDDKGNWFLCNDSQVTALDPKQTFNDEDQKQVYMLALRRVKT